MSAEDLDQGDSAMDPELMGTMPMDLFGGSVVSAAEDWLSSPEFERDLKAVYEEKSLGQGKSDRNIAFEIWLDTCIKLHAKMMALDDPSLVTLQMFLPAPDQEFIVSAIDLLRKQESVIPSFMELQREGVADLEVFEELTQAVYVQMAHCAELMKAQLSAGLNPKTEMVNGRIGQAIGVPMRNC